VREMRDSVEAEEAVKLSVSPTKPKEALFAEPEKPKEAKPAKPSKPAPAAEVEEVEAPPPKKVASKKPEATGSNLDDLVAGWDDE